MKQNLDLTKSSLWRTQSASANVKLAYEQALLFGRVSRERASERRSREGRPPRSRVLARLTSLSQIGELAIYHWRLGRFLARSCTCSDLRNSNPTESKYPIACVPEYSEKLVISAAFLLNAVASPVFSINLTYLRIPTNPNYHMSIKKSQTILKCFIDLKSSVWFKLGSENETMFCDT